ncbi:MAG: outer membrane protein transport protein [Thermoanaerobaculia bacterium]
MRAVSRAFLAIAFTSMVTAAAYGSGFSIFEQGAKATAMGGAFVATANDPSAIFYNPAGIAQQRHLTFLGGATFINFSNEFTGDPNSAFTAGESGKYNRHTFAPPNGYAIMPIGENLTVGVGMFGAFGLRTNWADPWAGRFLSRDADVKTVSVNPVIAWQTTSGRFAVGGGVEYRRNKVVLNANRGALNPFNGRFQDVANTRLESEWGSDIGWNVGILVKPTPRVRFGASYRADMAIDLDGQAEITQIMTNTPLDPVIKAQLPPNQAISTTMPFPATAAIGVAFSPTEAWDIEFDVTHMTWSEFKELVVEFKTTPAAGFTREQNWNDSSAYRFGVNHKVNEIWDVRFGLVYDSNPQPTEAVSPLLPDADRIGPSFGFGYHRGPWIMDVGLLALHFKERSTEGRNAEGFDGTYKTDATLWGVNFGYRF